MFHTAVFQNPKLSNRAKIVAGGLFELCNTKRSQAWATRETIARMCGRSVTTVRRGLEEAIHRAGQEA